MNQPDLFELACDLKRDLDTLISRYGAEIAALRENNARLTSLIEKQDEQIYRLRHPHGNPYDIGE